jgi:hypothetical protein
LYPARQCHLLAHGTTSCHARHTRYKLLLLLLHAKLLHCSLLLLLPGSCQLCLLLLLHQLHLLLLLLLLELHLLLQLRALQVSQLCSSTSLYTLHTSDTSPWCYSSSSSTHLLLLLQLSLLLLLLSSCSTRRLLLLQLLLPLLRRQLLLLRGQRVRMPLRRILRWRYALDRHQLLPV